MRFIVAYELETSSTISSIYIAESFHRIHIAVACFGKKAIEAEIG
jgi:hypothetical protein